MHRVKGLEFQYVFIAAVNNRVIPLPSAINRTDSISEMETLTSEKCLLYVALTRAQKRSIHYKLRQEIGIPFGLNRKENGGIIRSPAGYCYAHSLIALGYPKDETELTLGSRSGYEESQVHFEQW